MDHHTRQILQEPDAYRITAETGKGFVAVYTGGTTTLHTLTINHSLTRGVWVETGFSFLQPTSEPISYSVSLSCTETKEK